MTMSDDFDDIISGLDFDVPEDVIDVSTMSIEELLNKLDYLNETLFEMHEALNPQTQEARDMHSLRNAVQIELSKRSKR